MKEALFDLHDSPPRIRAFFSGLHGVASRSPYYLYCLRARSLCNLTENALVGRRSESYIFSALICCIKKSSTEIISSRLFVMAGEVSYLPCTIRAGMAVIL